MSTEAYERALRRLREHHEALDSAVGTRLGPAELVLFTHYDDERGRLRVLRIRTGFRDLFATRRLAQATLGKSWIQGREITDWSAGGFTVWYALPIDGGAYHVPVRPLRLRDPGYIRWFNGRQLGAGLGQQDNGVVSWLGMSMLPGSEA